ncbi:MAG: hypothetical protein CVU54_14450 [Deltaproteobacteria bacterium HGW-Deltaproteobacteria-12]|jgi:ATP-dependent DNA helicase RecQ|nr:MAG: hypothetical protein CVU54_14450 [Deltaproteobacteria bacterium HGW-Deltaproteobacteria-12]
MREIKKRYNIKIKEFYDQQEEVIKCLLDDSKQNNILYMAPAARGKTLPSLVAALENRRQKPKKMTLWFMPTIALAHDFIKRIEHKGNYYKIIPELKKIKHICFTGENDKSDKKIKIAKKGDPDILIISPESLEDPAFLAWLMGSGRNVGQIVLDEAHLFDEWGITFRRSYFIVTWLIHTLRRQNNNMKVIALSASLPAEKRNNVMRMLCFKEADTFKSIPKAIHIGPKISCYSIKSKNEKKIALIKILKKHLNKEDKGVIFSPYKKEDVRGKKLEWSVANIEKDIVPMLNLKDNEYACYTGNENTDERRRILDDLQGKRGKIKMLLATSAFGFGVDIHSIDFSVHVQVPDDMDRFYQEISRCSRTPMSGTSSIFYSPSEVAVQTKRLIGTLRADTIKKYLTHMGIKYIKKGSKTFSIGRVLKISDKTFDNQRRAQMSADAYYGHAFESIIFLYRHHIIDIKPLEPKHFPYEMNKLRAAFERGNSKGYRNVKHGGQDVFVPSVKFPITIIKNTTWPQIERLVKDDRKVRGERTKIFKKVGLNNTCHWKIIANHYELELQNKNDKIVTNCNHCNVCKDK